MRLAYLDCSSGISGDMFLAALLDAGVELDRLRAELAKIDVGPYEFTQSRVMRKGLAGIMLKSSFPIDSRAAI